MCTPDGQFSSHILQSRHEKTGSVSAVHAVLHAEQHVAKQHARLHVDAHRADGGAHPAVHAGVGVELVGALELGREAGVHEGRHEPSLSTT